MYKLQSITQEIGQLWVLKEVKRDQSQELNTSVLLEMVLSNKFRDIPELLHAGLTLFFELTVQKCAYPK